MADSTISFATDVKPLFRQKDRDSMINAFDLWKYDDVKQHQDAILGAVSKGVMPCDGKWPADQVATLKRWIDAGSPP